MSRSRSNSGFIVALFSASLLAVSGSLAISACSSSTDSGAGTTDGGTDAQPDARQIVDAGAPEDSATTPTQAQCLAKCKTDFPGASAKEDAIDQCWTDNCDDPCFNVSGAFDGGTDGGAAVDAGGMLCGTEVTSGVGMSPAEEDACNRCTEAFCCTAWKGCFGDPDCTAYDSCLGDCNTTP
jgi:hypothetical protein